MCRQGPRPHGGFSRAHRPQGSPRATHPTLKVRHGLQAAGKQRQGVAGATPSPVGGSDPLIEMSVKRRPTRTHPAGSYDVNRQTSIVSSRISKTLARWWVLRVFAGPNGHPRDGDARDATRVGGGRTGSSNASHRSASEVRVEIVRWGCSRCPQRGRGFCGFCGRFRGVPCPRADGVPVSASTTHKATDPFLERPQEGRRCSRP
jgi:hypothetical protein